MPETAELEAKVARCAELTGTLRARIAERIIGHEDVVDLVLTALFAGGHGLLEGVPGTGKTRLVRTLAQAIDATFHRVQFTPDLMPADVTGTTILVEGPDGRREMQFRPGPIFAHVVLADEINRATPKTQSAMLEAMEERQVTTGRESRPLPEPFFVLATQNPLEMEGTYPLPEAQLDRFLYKIVVDTPDRDELVQIIDVGAVREEEAKEPVTHADEVAELIALARHVVVPREVRTIIARLVLATHPASDEAPDTVRRYVRYGASPRGALAIALGLKAKALMAGRAHAERSDIPPLVRPALRHRVALNFEAEAEGLDTDRVIGEVLDAVPLR